MTQAVMNLSLGVERDDIGGAGDAVETFIQDHEVDPPAAFALMVCLDEVLGNIAEHGGAAPERRIDLTLTLDDAHVKLCVADDGPAFDPLREAPAPDLTSARGRRASGLGVHIIRKSMDFVTYHREEGRNVLTMVKNLRAGGTEPPH